MLTRRFPFVSFEAATGANWTSFRLKRPVCCKANSARFEFAGPSFVLLLDCKK